ncbi:MAG: oligosaccharide flippase family protein, partial [Proteobacteria bacterium]|nr:oligosaccharide flippase family protein [Pseudomonadota bacterium]
YFSLFFLALPISQFFGEPQLKLLIRVLAIGIIINASFIVQRAKLIKKINFKLQTTISVTASIVSGLVSIIMAYCGFAVWSLVAKTLISFLISSLLFWQLNKWKPSLIFSLSSFKEMFSFGSKLLLSGLIDTAYRNVYLLIIGKYFSSAELGYYTRADQFNNIPSQNITMVIQRVSYPVLSTIKNDRVRLKAAYRKLIKSLMLITFVLMIGLAAIVLSPKLSDLICLKKKATVYHALTLKRRRLYSLHVGYFQ